MTREEEYDRNRYVMGESASTGGKGSTTLHSLPVRAISHAICFPSCMSPGDLLYCPALH